MIHQLERSGYPHANINEATKDITAILYNEFSSRFKNTKMVSKRTTAEEYQVYIKLLSASYYGIDNFLFDSEGKVKWSTKDKDASSARAEASIMVEYGRKGTETFYSTGYGSYVPSLGEALAGVLALPFTLTVLPRVQAMAYLTVAKTVTVHGQS